MKEDYIPISTASLKMWETRFKDNIQTNGTAYGLSPQEISDVVTALDEHIVSVGEMVSKKNSAKAAVANNNIKKQAALKIIRRTVRRIKTHSSYSDSVGSGLGIIGTDSHENLGEVKPKLKAVYTGGKVLIKYPKKRLGGIELFCDRGNGYESLGRDTNPPFIDERPKLDLSKPEQRKYKALYFYKDKKVGQFSDELSIIVP